MWWSEAMSRRMQGRTARAIALLVLASAGLAGCGFHLQGAEPLPEGARNVYVATSDELTPFAVELRQSLERSGARIAVSAAAADTVVRIGRDRAGRRVLSVSAGNTPQEYELFYLVEYSVDRAGKEVVATQRLELTRNISFEASQLLAKDREEDVLREAMARDLANLVLRRLTAL
jgi:LPS-assembly lipoprotein